MVSNEAVLERRTDVEDANNKVNANLFVKKDFLNALGLWMKSFLVAMQKCFQSQIDNALFLSNSAQSDVV